jgi:hypothetical protein
VSLQVRDNDWERVVAILLALMDQLHYELSSAVAVQFLPELNEVRRLNVHVSWVLKYAFSETRP